jgi:DNA-binding LacI/PurR family transcriptional regulator
VRQAVNSLVTQGIVERLRAKGVFLVNSKGKSPLKRRITFVTPDISHSFYGSMVHGGEHCAREKGYEITIANSDFDNAREAAILAQLSEMDPHIVVLCTNGGIDCRRGVEQLIDRDFVVVMVDRHFADLNIGVVENDNTAIGRDATNTLLRLGHQRILYATVDEAMGLNVHDRFNGYKDVMLKAGLIIETLIVERPGDHWEVDNERRVWEWLQKHQDDLPTAIFAVNDTICVGIIRAIKRIGMSVPEDISIMGCADLDFARLLSEPLTTINQDTYGMGHRGVMLGIERLEKRGSRLKPQYIVQQHKIIERMTTQALNKNNKKSETRVTV